jgi:hypothetical protein
VGWSGVWSSGAGLGWGEIGCAGKNGREGGQGRVTGARLGRHRGEGGERAKGSEGERGRNMAESQERDWGGAKEGRDGQRPSKC